MTGSAGSGKSLVCRRFAALGLKVVNSDELARSVVMPGTAAHGAIKDRFGEKVLLKDGTLDRSRLRKLISSDSAKKKALEEIVHPAVLNALFDGMALAEKNGEPAVVAEVPLLFELGLETRFDLTITVAADEKKLLERIAKRDGVTLQEAKALVDLQMPQSEKVDRADLVVWNTGSVNELEIVVDKIHYRIHRLFPV